MNEPRPGHRTGLPGLAAGLALAAAALAALSVIDPRWLRLAWLPVPLVGLALVLERRPERRPRLHVVCSLAAVYWIAGLVGPGFGADSPAYYAYARSLLFDGDIDFFNEWERWGLAPLDRSPTGHMASAYSTGPALLWSPFVLLSHLYVLAASAVGSGFSADGYSLPYLRATALGTLGYATVACWLLHDTLWRRVGRLAWVAILGAVATSPMLFYLFVHPGMSHGLAFALSAALLWALDAAEREPSRRAWLVVGALVGLLLSVRWQSIVVIALPVALGLLAVARARARLAWLLAAAAVGVLAFSPQMLAWRVLYGEWLTLPDSAAGLRGGGSWFDPTSPRAFDVLLSAHHGLFTWTPLTALYALALVPAARRWGALGWGGLYLLAATTWLNGSLGDWHGSDAFGARRFDIAIPYLCLGLASLLQWLVSRPAALPVAALALATLWNVGLARIFQQRQIPGAAPLESVAAAQARSLRRLGESAGESLGGARGRALAYKLFVGEFFFENLNPSGVIRVAAPGAERYLSGAWSVPLNRRGPAHFRWAIYPRSCVRFPLDWPVSTTAGSVTARAHPDLGSIGVGVSLNHRPLEHFRLDAGWSDLRFVLPGAGLVPGENLLCLEFSDGVAGEPEERFAAAVTSIQIGS